jgi:hypothetical protein
MITTAEIIIIIIVGVVGIITLAIAWSCMAKTKKTEDEKDELNMRLLASNKNAEMYREHYLKEKQSREEWRARYINKL